MIKKSAIINLPTNFNKIIEKFLFVILNQLKRATFNSLILNLTSHISLKIKIFAI